MFQKIDHIGIAVKDLDLALPVYIEKFGLKLGQIESFDDLQIRIAFIPLGEVLIELIEPTRESANVNKFIQEKGEGIHHIAYRVGDIEAAIKELKEKGVKLRNDHPRPGGGGSLIAFIEPEDTNGVLTELVQRDMELF